MPLRPPTIINVRRRRGDTFAEIFSIDPIPDGLTVALTVQGLATLGGTVDTTEKSMSFPITNAAVYDAAVATYNYKVVGTYAGTNRTLIEGSWIVETPLVP